jgi:hypothetical protein
LCGRFLSKADSTEYRTFRALVAEIKSDIKTHMYNQAPPPPPPPPPIKFEASGSGPYDPSRGNSFNVEGSLKREAPDYDPDETEAERRERKRRSRWGPQASGIPPAGVAIPPPGIAVLGQPIMIPGSSAATISPIPALLESPAAAEFAAATNLMSMPLMPVQTGPGALAKVTRTNPALVAYAKQAYGRTDLDDDEWKQCEEAYKMNLVFQDIARKKAKNEEIERAGKFK